MVKANNSSENGFIGLLSNSFLINMHRNAFFSHFHINVKNKILQNSVFEISFILQE